MSDTLIDELEWRGLLKDATEGAAEHLGSGQRAGYIGFDPTARSLHVGSLRPIMGLVHLQRAGHHPVALVGGGTGLVGDPSGKTGERALLDRDRAYANAEGIRRQLEHYLDFDVASNPARMCNNLDWLDAIPLLDFLRDTGKHFSVNVMLRKESVRRRLEDDTGISYTEFSYLLLQAYDFLELHRREGCTVQMGGSDQWGNIVAGIDLIRRVEGTEAFGLTFPLVMSASGEKFGKTESGTVWLDPELTSPFRFYQFWINTEDDDVVDYLASFTLLPRDEVEALARETREAPHRRAAQKALAEDVTRRTHGESGLVAAKRATEALFGGALDGLSAEAIEDIFADVPSSEVPGAELVGDGSPLVEVLSATGLASSKGDARRSLEGGGIYVNGVRAEGADARVHMEHAIEGRFVVLRKGKKRHHLVRVLR